MNLHSSRGPRSNSVRRASYLHNLTNTAYVTAYLLYQPRTEQNPETPGDKPCFVRSATNSIGGYGTSTALLRRINMARKAGRIDTAFFGVYQKTGNEVLLPAISITSSFKSDSETLLNPGTFITSPRQQTCCPKSIHQSAWCRFVYPRFSMIRSEYRFQHTDDAADPTHRFCTTNNTTPQVNMTEPAAPADTSMSIPFTAATATNSCPDCGKQFTSKKGVTRHMLGHSPPTLECETCGQRFRRENQLQRHIHVHDPAATYNVCDGRGGRFSRRDVLVRHHVRCPMCIDQRGHQLEVDG